MSAQTEECERSYATADAALGHIREMRLPADPESFELWYAYASGTNPVLSKQVAEFVARGLRDTDLAQLYRQFVKSSKMLSQITLVGEQIDDEVEQIVGMIEAAILSSENFRTGLADSGEVLGSKNDRETLRAIVESLVHLAKLLERQQTALGKDLRSSSVQISALTKDLAAAKLQSLMDPLTSLFNRKHFDSYLKRTIDSAARRKQPFSLVLADVDHFKKFNDTHGHLIGDHVLRLIATEVMRAVTGKGIGARYGGEEFALVLPRADLASALEIAEQLRETVGAREVYRRNSNDVLGRITISAGVAEWQQGESVEALITRADACLYRAKRSGRDCIVEGLTPGSCEIPS
jgi:diguanylate cyclase